MINKRYTALSLIALTALFLGFAALGAPAPFRGPLLTAESVPSSAALGLYILAQPLHLSHALGLILIAVSTFTIWVIAIAWEYRRRHESQRLYQSFATQRVQHDAPRRTVLRR